MSDDAPLIITAELDPELQARLDALRQAHFPADKLLVGAHLTLFHRLPAAEHDAILEALQEVWPGPMATMARGPIPLGRGVAIGIDAPGLKELHADLQTRFQPWLIPQDRQGLKPHVTIQNKAAATDARALLRELKQSWAPHEGSLVALQLWRYRGGPWEAAGRVS